MNLHEPMTVATDYLLAVAATIFGVQLLRAGKTMWAVAFFFTALASLLGGTYHGIAWEPLWKPTVYAVGLASLFLLAGLGRAFAVAGAIKFSIYAIWMARHDDFKYVIYDYGLTLLIVGTYAAVRRNWWIVGSVVVSVIAAAVQQSGLTLHRHFNHNDLYHLIQIVALWLLYRGGLALTTPATGRSTIQPR